MYKDKQVYRGIIKGTAIFGGVQVVNILINILRGKFIAIFLGPVGMGVYTLLFSSVNTIIQFSGLGIGLSAVKDISIANESGDIRQISKVIMIFRRLVVASAIMGGLITACAAPWLSELSFGDSDYSWSFVALGVMVLLTILTGGETALLQGTRRLKNLAIATITGSLSGLVVGIPLYYFFGTKGIVPSMITLALVTYLTNLHFARKIKLEKVVVTKSEIFTQSKMMVALGVILMVSTLLGTFTQFLLNAYVRYISGSEYDVGLLQSATSITNQYVGLVFSAMAVDYFPRLAAICSDKLKLNQAVNQQIEIVQLIATPLVIAIIVTTPLIIKILLTDEFLIIVPLLRWLAFGLFFKALTFPMGYIAFARGDKKMFFLLEGVFGNLLVIGLNIVGYLLCGLVGVGISFLMSYIIYMGVLITVTKIRYDFELNSNFFKFIIPLFTLTIAVFLVSLQLEDYVWANYISVAIMLLAFWYSLRELNKRIDIFTLIRSKFF